MAILANNKPCSGTAKPVFVTTPQGFSVSYQDKLLYSKYNPAKSILSTIDNLTVLPGTIILCCSPVLDYGISQLKEKLPSDCLLLGCEKDQQLLQFEQEQNKIATELVLLTEEELYDLPVIINKNQYTFSNGTCIKFCGQHKRVLRLDFSAGIQFASNFYDELYNSCTRAIMTFWTNRITLTHFGRRYSKNFFTNLRNLEDTIPIEHYFSLIDRPIIVCGAGQSLDTGIKDFIKDRENYFILCADTALQPLLAHNIIPDGVFVEEAQHVISKAFIGTQKYNYHLFASLSSLPQLGHTIPRNRLSYFTTQYTDSFFLENLREMGLLPYENNPFGSVGLTVVYYALRFRKDTNIPIYIYGLDFSYSAGLTHAKETLAHKTRLQSSCRIKSIQNYEACFNSTAFPFYDKQNRKFFTTPVLDNYGNLFRAYFGNTENLFDSGDCGETLNITAKKPEILSTKSSDNQNIDIITKTFTSEKMQKLKLYFETEEKILLRLKDILTGKINLSKEELEEEIKKIVQKREYLYLHFPDGYCYNNSQAFLNRIRAEIDFFLKYI